MRLKRKTFTGNWLAAIVPLAALTAAAWSYIDAKQRELLFAPDKQELSAVASAELSYQEKWIPHSSALHAWWAPLKQADAPVILYLHGARRNLTWHANRISFWRQMGFSVLAIDIVDSARAAAICQPKAAFTRTRRAPGTTSSNWRRRRRRALFMAIHSVGQWPSS